MPWLQGDLDPMSRVLKDEAKRQVAAAAVAAIAPTPPTETGAEDGDRSPGEGGKGEEDLDEEPVSVADLLDHKNVKLVPTRRKVSAEEATQWRKTDNIIMTVLNR